VASLLLTADVDYFVSGISLFERGCCWPAHASELGSSGRKEDAPMPFFGKPKITDAEAGAQFVMTMLAQLRDIWLKQHTARFAGNAEEVSC